jgi:hypothetical protein
MPAQRAANDNRTLDAHQAANDNYNLADDMLWGAGEIALFLYGDRRKRRKVYHLAATSRLPHSKPGSMICARKSVLLEWIGKQEARSLVKERKQA